ncbi:MAG: hypothetical protein Q9213_004342 [Squamulea squamosa]
MKSQSPSPSTSPAAPMRRKPKSWARKCERYCCSVVIYIPLVFVYGLTTWAVWVAAGMGFRAKTADVPLSSPTPDRHSQLPGDWDTLTSRPMSRPYSKSFLLLLSSPLVPLVFARNVKRKSRIERITARHADECLEKTRYLSPLRKSMRRYQAGVQGQTYGRQLAEIHANAVPGATRDEEGEEMLVPSGMSQSPALQALRSNYNDMERSRERERYEDYLDEQDSEKLPNAFDLGWKANLRNLFGEVPIYWFLPVCNSVGDGWHWEPSQKWLEAREDLKRQRGSQWDQQPQYGQRHDSRYTPSNAENGDIITSNGAPIKTDNDSASSTMSLKTLRRRESFEEGDNSDDVGAYDISSDEEENQVPQRRDTCYGSTELRNHSKEENGWKKWD